MLGSSIDGGSGDLSLAAARRRRASRAPTSCPGTGASPSSCRQAAREAQPSGSRPLRMRLPFEPSLDDREPRFYALPQPALPPKDGARARRPGSTGSRGPATPEPSRSQPERADEARAAPPRRARSVGAQRRAGAWPARRARPRWRASALEIAPREIALRAAPPPGSRAAAPARRPARPAACRACCDLRARASATRAGQGLQPRQRRAQLGRRRSRRWNSSSSCCGSCRAARCLHDRPLQHDGELEPDAGRQAAGDTQRSALDRGVRRLGDAPARRQRLLQDEAARRAGEARGHARRRTAAARPGSAPARRPRSAPGRAGPGSPRCTVDVDVAVEAVGEELLRPGRQLRQRRVAEEGEPAAGQLLVERGQPGRAGWRR